MPTKQPQPNRFNIFIDVCSGILLGITTFFSAVLVPAESPLYAGLSYGAYLDASVPFVMSALGVGAASAAVYGLATWAMHRLFPWSQQSWQTGLMLDAARRSISLVPLAWALMAAFLPWSWPGIFIIALVSLPLAVSFLQGVVVSLFYHGDAKKLLMAETLLNRFAPNQVGPKSFFVGLPDSVYDKIVELALYLGHTDIVQGIIEDKWNLLTDDTKECLFSESILRGDKALVQKIVEKADTVWNWKGEQYQGGANFVRFAIFYGKETSVVEYLVKQGAPVNVKTGFSPLQCAVISNQRWYVEFLLGHNVDVDYVSSSKKSTTYNKGRSSTKSAFDLAKQKGNEAIIKLLESAAAEQVDPADAKPGVVAVPNPAAETTGAASAAGHQHAGGLFPAVPGNLVTDGVEADGSLNADPHAATGTA